MVGEIAAPFRFLNKNATSQSDMSDHAFRSSNDGNECECNPYVSDMRYQKRFLASQPMNAEFEFFEKVRTDTGYSWLRSSFKKRNGIH